MFIYLPYLVGMWNFAQTFPLAIFHEIRWQKSCGIIKSTVFQIQNFEKNWQENVHVGIENDWSGSFVLLYGWNNGRCMVGVFSIQSIGKLWSWAILSFATEPRKLRLLITSEWIWIEKNPTVHLHYFIHRVRQNCQTNHFPFLRERFLVSFFQNFEFQNRCFFDDVTWLLSTNFMKDRQVECLGKISHP